MVKKISTLLENWNGYAQINSLQIIENADKIAQQLSITPKSNIVSQKACDVFEELVGCESALAEILAGELPYLEFREINRSNDNEPPAYFDFKIIPVNPEQPEDGALLLIRNSLVQG